MSLSPPAGSSCGWGYPQPEPDLARRVKASRAYDLADPPRCGMAGDTSDSADRFSVVFLLRVESTTEPATDDTFCDRHFVDHALGDLGPGRQP